MLEIPRANAKAMTKDYKIVPANFAVIMFTTEFERKYVLECECKNYRILRNFDTEEEARRELSEWIRCDTGKRRTWYRIAKYV